MVLLHLEQRTPEKRLKIVELFFLDEMSKKVLSWRVARWFDKKHLGAAERLGEHPRHDVGSFYSAIDNLT